MREALALIALGACVDSGTNTREVAFDVVNDAPRFIASVRLGNGTAFSAVVDTGSSGLRVVSRLVPISAFSLGPAPAGSFHGGLHVEGTLVSSAVSVGDLTTSLDIAIEAITSVSCDGCDADAENPFFGYPALLGLGMRTASNETGVLFGSPLAQVDSRASFVVSASRDRSPGVIRYAPDDDNRFLRFQLAQRADRTLPNGIPGWNDAAVPTCISNSIDPSLSHCSGGLLDTGNPVVQVEIPGASTVRWAPGTEVGVVVGAGDAPLASFDYTIADVPKAGVDATQTDDGAQPLINLGVALFTRYDVLFDQRNGQVGLAAH